MEAWLTPVVFAIVATVCWRGVVHLACDHQLLTRHGQGSAARAAGCPGGRQARHGPLADQITLELGQLPAEHVNLQCTPLQPRVRKPVARGRPLAA